MHHLVHGKTANGTNIFHPGLDVSAPSSLGDEADAACDSQATPALSAIQLEVCSVNFLFCVIQEI